MEHHIGLRPHVERVHQKISLRYQGRIEEDGNYTSNRIGAVNSQLFHEYRRRRVVKGASLLKIMDGVVPRTDMSDPVSLIQKIQKSIQK